MPQGSSVTTTAHIPARIMKCIRLTSKETTLHATTNTPAIMNSPVILNNLVILNEVKNPIPSTFLTSNG